MFVAGPGQCREGFANSPLVVTFRTWEDAIAGGPLHTGLPLDPKSPQSPSVNLNHPRHAAALIRAGIDRGWKHGSKGAFVIDDGLPLLANIEETI